MLKKNQKKTLHDLFVISIFIKGIDGVLQLIAGIFLIFVKSESLSRFIKYLFQHELVQDPTDVIAIHVINFFQHLSSNSLSFAAIYLIVNGLVKILLFSGLWYKKLWTYPLAGVILFMLVIYQISKFFVNHSIILMIFIIIDTILLF